MEGGGRPSAVQAALLAASTAATALLYSVYRQKARVARGLEGARRVRLDGELRTVLLEAPGRCVPYAVIEGVVQSVKETLSSQFVENCKGVIQRLTLQEHKMVWNRTTHLWNDYEKMIHQRTNTAPFELVPLEEGAGGAVRVMKPLEAAELSLETVYEKFHPSVQSFTDVIGHYISGERPKGIQETEQMLKVGTALTGVGELVLDNATIKLQPPKQGMPYYLSTSDFETLLQKQESSARFWKILTVLFGFATCAFLFFLLRKQYRQQRERRHLRQLQQEFRLAQERLVRAEAGHAPKNLCVICLSNAKACVFLDCGHLCSCHECYLALPEPKKCPICRQPIVRVVPLYNS
ncbi:mitochondrial ubiquitin ligase activator of NFKB 1 isoform X1 [Colius striatus]|uniref:mitochondrial ubiquitin ligase activator of NFKB 1 isoform X1 n=1 Tax=Colius striatus TaxID=57412 RepID=UPI002B1D7112|nr:mitochondrial ubiquitin ligase activator of NFKB 1 isoform X1 [Colius striatus]